MRRLPNPGRWLSAAVSLMALAAALAMAPRPAGATGTAIPENSVSSYGAVALLGPAGGMRLAAPLVGMAPTPTGNGYWLVASDGGVFTFGDARFFGSTGALRLNAPIVGMAATPTGGGYWLLAADGGVFSFGDARFFGSTGGTALNQPVVGMAATPTGNGYWLVASDGGVFTFGDARFLGSTGGMVLNQPVVGMAATRTGLGYWMVAADGGVFTFGDAPFLGSTGGVKLNRPVIGMAATRTGRGYWMVAADGGVFTFGDAPFLGSAASAPAGSAPAVGMAAGPGGYWIVHGENIAPARPGDQGPNVSELKARLLTLGFWIPSAQGSYDDLTVQAVYAFQKVSGLPVTGTVDASTAALLSSATRPLPGVRSGDLIEVDKGHEVLFVIRSGRVLWAFNTSTGTDQVYYSGGVRAVAHTPEGTWTILRQVDGTDVSPLGVLWRPKYFTSAGHAIHGYSEVPPYPASHGCVRVTDAAINFLWGSGLAPIGSTVWVHD